MIEAKSKYKQKAKCLLSLIKNFFFITNFCLSPANIQFANRFKVVECIIASITLMLITFPMRFLLSISLVVCCYATLSAQKGYAYIGAPSGLNIRSGPGLDHDVVEKLAYGRWVQVWDTTDVELTIRDEGKLVTGNWVKISFPPYLTASSRDDIAGYAFGPFLTDAIEKIPPHTLLNAWEILQYQRDDLYVGEWQYNITTAFSHNSGSRNYPYKFSPYFDEYGSAPVLYTDPYGDKNEYDISMESVQDTIKAHVLLELISDARAESLRKKQIANPYELDRTSKLTDLTHGSWENDFLLPINNGEDSIRITDYDGEGYISKQFVGTLEIANQYVVNESYEEPNHRFYDVVTGDSRHFTTGYPLISPDGEYVLELFSVYYEDGCRMIVSSLNEEFLLTESFIVNFSTWFANTSEESYFWISDREVCIQVAPVSQTESARSMREDNTPLPSNEYQWLYLHIN